MDSTLYVHLQNICSNLETVSQRLHPGVKRMAVVKTDAYGHGAVPVAKYLQDKVDWFCVAHLEEAIELREHGIKLPLLVFEVPPKGREAQYKNYDITASISDLSVFERLEPGTDCHLHFDTGMFRLGLLPAEVEQVREKMQAFPELNYTGICTHFANADVAGHPSVAKQLDVFKTLRSEFPESLMAHTANSGAIFYHQEKELQFDAVRPGISLYGYAPGDTDIPGLKPAAEWRSRLMQVKPVNKGDAVGYGSRWEAPEDGWLGIIQVGYSDGLFRALSNRIMVEISGMLFPMVGTISMDYSAVFLGNQNFSEGEEVTLLRDGELSAKEWARHMGTIPYEITTAIKPSVPREYL